MNKKTISVLWTCMAFSACSVKVVNTDSGNVTRMDANGKNILVQGTLFTAIYQQRAAEYKALCIQAYNLATLRVDEYFAHNTAYKHPAIVTDIDETFLDNSPVAVAQALKGKGYEQAAWEEWTAKAACDTLSGALAFFRHAASKGAEIFYVTNRSEREREGTLKNIQKFGFPTADNAHLILRADVGSKESRRQRIAETHDIILLCGDNLSDFSSLFDKKTTEERNADVLSNAALFGKKFIVLPNATYGDWLSSLYDYNYKLSMAQVDSVLLQKARSH